MSEPVIIENYASCATGLCTTGNLVTGGGAAALRQRIAEPPVRTGATVRESETFADISRILVKRILDLQEALDFYQLNFQQRQPDNPLGFAAPCSDSVCPAQQAHLEFSHLDF